MLNQATINEMREMHLSAMADAYQIQIEDPKMKDLSFDERLGILVNAEYSNRKSNKLKRLLHDANLEISTACIPGIEFNAQRKLDRNLILQLASCDYILEKRNIFITGATGSGKTYLSCAFGHEACTHYLSTIFVRIPDLLGELRTAAGDAEEFRNDRKLMKVIEKYTKPKLLILDEWLLIAPSPKDVELLFEIIHKRSEKTSTIFCSQFRKEGWYERLGGKGSTLADALMDRINYNSYEINIEGSDPNFDVSMRARYGLKQTGK